MSWVGPHVRRGHGPIRAVPAVAWGLLERRLSVPAMCQMHMAEVRIAKGKNVPITLNQCRFLPLHRYAGLSGRRITTIFKAKRFTGTPMLSVLTRLVKRLRQAWPDTSVDLSR